MIYMGSKSKIAKDIVPILQSYIDKNKIELFIDACCGGCNVIDKIKAPVKIANDINEYLIELYKNIHLLQTLPDCITKENYSEVREHYYKKSNKYEKWYIGAIGFLASYNGRFFDGGYSGIINTKAGTTRNYYAEAKRNLERQIKDLQDITFTCEDYKNIKAKNALIYYDIPYQDKKQYGVSKNFNHKEFWEHIEEESKNNIVIVSETQAPDTFKCIWQQEVIRTIDNTKRIKSTEKLFLIKNSY